MTVLTQTNFDKKLINITDSISQSFVTPLKLNRPDKIHNPLQAQINANIFSYPRASFGIRQPYELSETYRVIDTESFVASAFKKKKTLIIKDGFILSSENTEDIDYLNYRLEEMAYVTNKSFKELLTEIINSLINNHNAFIMPVRSIASSSGSARTINGELVEPLAGYYVLPEHRVKVLQDVYGQVVGYQYTTMTTGVISFFEPNQIIHLKIDTKPGHAIGTPPLEAVIDDIKALRQIEESLERLIYKLSTPLFHVKVGTEDKPAGIDRVSGRKEVEIANEAFLNMEDSGGLTTNERVEIKVIGAESQALRLSGYLDYFKNRVLVGLNMSDLDFGVSSASVSTGATTQIGRALADNVAMYQSEIESFITDYIFAPILLESPKYVDKYFLTEHNKVKLKFVINNQEDKIKMQSHYINEYNSKLITRDEYRSLTGKRPLTEEEKSTLTPIKENSSTAALVNSITNPVNQHSDIVATPIRDSLKLDQYVNNLYNNVGTLGANVLTDNLSKLLKENELNFDTNSLLTFSDSLTAILQKCILQATTKESAINIIEKLVCKKIIEIIDLQQMDNKNE